MPRAIVLLGVLAEQKVTVYTDSAAVMWMLKPTSKYSGRCLRWILRASEWPIHVEHRAGVKHCLPDMLTRCVGDIYTDHPKRPISPLTGVANVLTRAARRRAPLQDPPASVPAALDERPEPEEPDRPPTPEPTPDTNDAGIDESFRPWRCMFPDSELDDDVSRIRLSLVLWHQVADKVALLKSRQLADPKIAKLLHLLAVAECTSTCTACSHEKSCVRAH